LLREEESIGYGTAHHTNVGSSERLLLVTLACEHLY
jgi:hypothetical protein